MAQYADPARSSHHGPVRHAARLYNHQGTPVLVHHKIRPLVLESAREDIEAGTTLHLLLGPWGLLAVGICRDFLDLDAHVWDDVLADVVLVPSMGVETTMSAHRTKASGLGVRCAPVIAVANQPPPGRPCACRGLVQKPDRQQQELTAATSNGAPYLLLCSDLSS